MSAGQDIKISQALFGYDDGHRLIAASERVDDLALSAILPFTDLTPSVGSGSLEGYWTGIPVTSKKMFALMRTWLAPEMPRPGCVWTHVLLIPFADLQFIHDLQVFSEHLVRPALSEGFSRYENPVRVKVPVVSRPTTVVDEGEARQLMWALYGPKQSKMPVLSVVHSGFSLVFAAWSQQWPSLRCKFSFRAATESVDASSNSRFARNASVGAVGNPAWIKFAVDDLSEIDAGPFRRFIWRYGPSLRREIEEFSALASLFAETSSNDFGPTDSESVLGRAADALPDVGSGSRLKSELVSCAPVSGGLIPRPDLQEVLEFLVSDERRSAFIPPVLGGCEQLQRLLTQDRAGVCELADRALAAGAPVGSALIDALAETVPAASVVAPGSMSVSLRAAVLARNPRLLDSPAIETVDEANLLALQEFLPEDDSELAAAVAARLVPADVPQVAEIMFARFSNEVIGAVLRMFSATGQARVGDGWIRTLAAHPDAVLQSQVLRAGVGLRALWRLVRVLGEESPALTHAGTRPWIEALRTAVDDLDGAERLEFLTFLLIVAIGQPAPGSERLFEVTFEPVHRALEQSRLPWNAFRVLTRHLPPLGWRDNWDNCRKLRTAVVRSYVQANLDATSFGRLAKHTNLVDLLDDEVRQIDGAARLLRKS